MDNLLEILESKELAPRAAASLLEQDRHEVATVARGRITDGRVQVRRNAALLLSLLEPPDPFSLVRLDLARKDADPVVRRHAMAGFSQPGVEPVVSLPALVRGLADDDEGVSLLAGDGLERILRQSGPESFMKVIDLLAKGNFVSLIRGTTVFKRLGDRAIVTLTITIAHENTTIRRWARETLASFGAAAIPVLIDALRRPTLRAAATATLEAMDDFDEGHMASVAGLFGDGDTDLQSAAVRVLGAMKKVFERRRQRPADVRHPEFYGRALDDAQLEGATEGVRAEDLLFNLQDNRWFVRANSVLLMARVVTADDSREVLLGALRPLIRDPDPPVRLAIAQSAPAIGGLEAIPLLLELAADAKARVSAAAKASLLGLGPGAVPSVFDAIGQTKSLDVVQRGIDVIAEGGPEALAVIHKRARIGRIPMVRAAAIECLVVRGDKDARTRGLLIDTLRDEDPGVRRAGANALAQLVRDDKHVLAALKNLTATETEPAVRRAAALAADRVAGIEPKPKVMPATPMPLPGFDQRLFELPALEKARGALDLTTLKRLTGAGRPVVRRNVALAFSLHPVAKDEDVLRWLVLSLKDEDERIRIAAARTLGRSGGPAPIIVPALAELLTDAGEAFEGALMEALMAFDRRAIGPALEALAERPHIMSDVASRLAAAIPDAMIPALAAYLHRPARYGVRRLAADLLAALGPKAEAAWPDLAQAVEDPLGRLRTRVVHAIGRCAPPGDAAYETLMVIGHHDARASIKGAVEEAIEALIARMEPAELEAAGGVDGQKQAWNAAIAARTRG